MEDTTTTEYFPVTSISRADLVGINGFTEEDVAKISDEEIGTWTVNVNDLDKVDED